MEKDDAEKIDVLQLPLPRPDRVTPALEGHTSVAKNTNELHLLK